MPTYALGRQNMTIDHIELVKIYQEATSRPRQAVAKHFKITLREASRQIALARAAGELPPWTGTRSSVSPPATLTPTQRADAREIFEGHVDGRTACTACGGIHLRACPRVKRREFHPDGSLIAEEYWPPGTWERDAIVFPETAYEPDE